MDLMFKLLITFYNILLQNFVCQTLGIWGCKVRRRRPYAKAKHVLDFKMQSIIFVDVFLIFFIGRSLNFYSLFSLQGLELRQRGRYRLKDNDVCLWKISLFCATLSV